MKLQPPPLCPRCCKPATKAGDRGRMRCQSCGHVFKPEAVRR